MSSLAKERILTSNASQESLPSFERPPVVETVLGIQFKPLNKFKNAHLGSFWKRLGKEWPNVSDAPYLMPQFERFEAEAHWVSPGLQFKLTHDAGSRIQVRNAMDDRMLQLQNGRLHYNWLGLEGGAYPRYKQMRPEFEALFQTFQLFFGGRVFR